jgi:hypothetical protein
MRDDETLQPDPPTFHPQRASTEDEPHVTLPSDR